MSLINFKNISKQIEILKLDHYTKKLDTSSFIKLLLFSQLIESESLRAMSDVRTMAYTLCRNYARKTY
ncbi:DUF4372 domain-containing protein [Macrococcoides canis]|uniref:DUF4372 domain-containing protein n=1 Tax=Macrococcoides canis TaxID=1855823 RepID=UPI00165DDE70|nr:DUF4372 domain-containing protein [Macrococcus canis]